MYEVLLLDNTEPQKTLTSTLVGIGQCREVSTEGDGKLLPVQQLQQFDDRFPVLVLKKETSTVSKGGLGR